MKKLFLSFFLSILLLNAKSQVDISKGLCSYWEFDGNLDDLSNNNFNGTAFNSPIFSTDRFGNPGNMSIELNGTSQYISFGDILDSVFSKSPEAKFTISGWLNPSSIPSGRSVIIGKAAGGVGPYQWYVYIDSDGKIVAALCSTPNGPTDYIEKKSTKALQVGKWSHFVFTFDGSLSPNTNRVNIYLDTLAGSLMSNVGNMGSTSQNTNQHISIGASNINSAPGNFYKGKVDEIRIHSRILTQDEITYLYLIDKSMKVDLQSGLQAYWPLDSSGNDISGNKYHGTLSNNPSFIVNRYNKPYTAAHFNGTNQYMYTGDILDSVFCSKPNAFFSISGWLKPDSYRNQRQIIIGKSAGGTGPYQWYVYLENNSKIVAALCSTPYGPTDYVESISTLPVSLTNWHHFVFTFDGSKSNRVERINIYLDTIKGYSPYTNVGSMGSTTVNTNQYLTMAAGHNENDPFTPSNQYLGSLDDIRIYNRVLNILEIGALFREIPTYHLAVNELESTRSQPDFVVYPNPSSSELYIKSIDFKSNELKCEIYNSSGILCHTQNLSDLDNPLNISSLSSGIYFIHLSSPKISCTKPFLKN